MESSQVAVFFDFENVAITAEEVYGRFDLGAIMTAAEQWGRCTIRRAYCDWTGFESYQQDLIEHSVELTQLFRYSARHRKNAADIQMVVDALEAAFAHPEIATFVLVTGDSDFSAVARKLRAYGKIVVGMGLRQSTSEVLVKACDHFVLYDTLIEPDTRTAAHRLERARLLLLGAMRTLLPQVETDVVNASQLKVMMLKMDAAFNEAELGYRQFRNFLEAQSDLVDLKMEDKVLWVALKPSAELAPYQDEMLTYRVTFSAAGLRLMDPHTRTGILQDLYHLLRDAPATYTLGRAVLQLKAQYDADNVLRSREEVQDVVRLMKYPDVFRDPPQSWQLDHLTLQPGLTAQDFVDHCECAYLMALIEKNITIQPDLLALLIFGTLDQEARVERLADIAQRTYAGKSAGRPVTDCAASDWRADFQAPLLQEVLRDLDAITLEDAASLARATELNDKGLRIRTTDFEQARLYFLRAARMMCELLAANEPGASRSDLAWYLASYCAASAGAYFFRFDYTRAEMYYLAFFVLAKETEPVWDKVQRLVEPLVSFYFTIAANRHQEMLEHPPGRTHPARIAIALYMHHNLNVRQEWLTLAQEMYATNPAIARMVIQRLEVFENTTQIPGARATREAFQAIAAESGEAVQNPGNRG